MKENHNDIDDDVLVKYLLREATDAEALQVNNWLAKKQANLEYFEHLRLIWEESIRLSSESIVDEDLAWERFRDRIHKRAYPLPILKKLNTFRWLRIAALLIVLVGAAVLIYTLFNEKKLRILAIRSQNKVITDTLTDGSVVTLNKNSLLTYPSKFKGNTRTIALKGEAFFNVTPDKRNPFIINVNDVRIKVVGTSFNVKSIDGNTEVIVETGIVQVFKQDRSMELGSAEKITVKKGDSVLVKEVSTDKLYNYFRSREFECDHTPLWKLVAALNNAYNADIVIERNELRSLLLTTTFNNESLDNILSVISETFNISVTKTGSQIILK